MRGGGSSRKANISDEIRVTLVDHVQYVVNHCLKEAGQRHWGNVIHHKALGSSSKDHRLSGQSFLHRLHTVEHHSWLSPNVDTVDLPIAL
ncbi:hypothetical protein SKAU_G00378320 [Synaphobranchus kaupii]|uniref:Uncharacterized protein n=1 Tax=Synaphobranchus kaupii TaxID=118154 RepID=A0A9Q1ED91_SYNKA|nr:hypothetical protein SKAU_G00378320 [Synaphobranchus kaupii]